MQVFNRHVSGRGLTVFGFETLLISGSILLAAQMHGSLHDAIGGIWKIVAITNMTRPGHAGNGMCTGAAPAGMRCDRS